MTNCSAGYPGTNGQWQRVHVCQRAYNIHCTTAVTFNVEIHGYIYILWHLKQLEIVFYVLRLSSILWIYVTKQDNFVAKKGIAHTRLLSVRFRSWSRFLAVSLQVMWVINPAVDCHYFPLGLQLPPQPLRGLLPISMLGEQTHEGCEQFA